MTRNKDPPKRRRTPADDESVMSEWQSLEADYLKKGYSRRAAHEQIAQRYHTSRVTVFRHLSGVPSGRKPGRPRNRAEEQDPHHNKRQQFYKRFVYDPARYVAPLFKTPGEELSIEDIALRLEKKHAYRPRLAKLEDRLTTKDPRTGEVVLEPSGDAGLYRLTVGLFEKNRR